ncbi:MAG TPA: hypothetical protein VK209_09380, partial [Candidatus Sulfotelmatobacter sp.]|nr:hypothetical protein [Candidatus Sulfotelmatobacter sp.]
METVLEIIDKRGRHIVEHAIDQIIRSQYEAGLVSSALRYYAKVTLPRVLPIFPTLTSISCEMTDGDPADVVPFATAMVLITSSGDLHDDIIDRSIRKYSRKTVLGRFGTSVTLLAGDALLVQGQALLQIACETLKKEQRRAILRLIPKA